jgi:alpha-mannosidase
MKKAILVLVLMCACVSLAQDAGAQKAPRAPAVAAQPTKPTAAKPAAPDLTKQPTLYVVGYAHLDTQWRWDYVTTIKEYLPKTMRLNFDWFEKYPHYVFNFSGANRYRMMKEYYPADYAKVKKYVAAGRWFPAGSSMEENDVNSPSAESIIRQILYGKEFFRREFGKTSAEYMLPDCFGFPASLPSILAHTGIKGFSTQKLSASWQPAPHVGGPDSPEKTPPGIPFNVGIWQGPDGKSVIAALNPGGYGSQISYDLSKTPQVSSTTDAWQQRNRPTDWVSRININGNLTGVFADYMYYGTGDTGGSAQEYSIKLMEAMATKSKTVLPVETPRGQPPPTGPQVQVGNGPVKVISATAEQMFLDIKPEQTAKFPRYQGDLELINHSAGSISSQAYMKRWNRMNEVLADAAEKASVGAEVLGARPYPLKRLTDAWTLVMGGQFHDIIPGTSLPKAYEYSWNDEVLAMNQFAGVLTSATEAVAAEMNTQGEGSAIVVFNSLNVPREDVVEAAITFPNGTPKAVRVAGPDGQQVPAQWSGDKVLFLAKVPPVGFAVYDVQSADAPMENFELKVSASSLENARYTIKLNENGDVSSIFDKRLGKELLAAPIRLAISTDNPKQWPAWNMDFEDEQRAPRAYVGGPAKVRVLESGPVRVALEVTRETEGSKFVQTIRLAAGDAGNRVEFANAIDWMTKEANLKATFPLSAVNEMATYNWDIGTIQRPNENERQFEVASHQFVDLTDQGGAYGVTILTDAKNASDKLNDNTVRLTLVRTPGTRGGYTDQGTQDLGHHEFVFGLAGHAGDYRAAQTDWQAWRLNQPPTAFQSAKHAGALGRNLSLLNVSDSRVRVLAMKKAEQSNEIVVRLVELDGKPAKDVRLKFMTPATAAREINGAEEPVGTATVSDSELVTSFTAFQPRTFAVKLGPPRIKPATVTSVAVKLPYNTSVATPDGRPAAGAMDNQGRALPAEMLPGDIAYGGIHFSLAPTGFQKPAAVIARGQSITLPAGKFTRVYVLAASAGGDQRATFRVGDKAVDLAIPEWTGFIGQWDNRLWKTVAAPPPTAEEQARIDQRRQQVAEARKAAGDPTPLPPPRPRTMDVVDSILPGYVKTAPVAWFASHRHESDGTNEPYAYSYLFAYAIDVPARAKTLTLPYNERIRVLAVTVSDEGAQVQPAVALYDTLQRPAEEARTQAATAH